VGNPASIGPAVAIAYAREGADITVDYLNEHDDAKETERRIKVPGRKAFFVPGDILSPQHRRAIVEKALAELGGVDILVTKSRRFWRQLNAADTRFAPVASDFTDTHNGRAHGRF
jgi:NAD(P)-dependent dehydrogenase (short-subunit alcohol dehydrogenase family)